MQESSKNFAKPREWKFTIYWVRLKLHLLNVQNDPLEIFYKITCKITDTSKSTNWLSFWESSILEKNARWTFINECQELHLFVQNGWQTNARLNAVPSLQLQTWFISPNMIYAREGLKTALYGSKCWNCCSCFPKTAKTYQKRWKWTKYTWQIISKIVPRSHSTIDSCTRDLLSNASAQRYPDHTLTPFANFLLEQMKEQGLWYGCNFWNSLPVNAP